MTISASAYGSLVLTIVLAYLVDRLTTALWNHHQPRTGDLPMPTGYLAPRRRWPGAPTRPPTFTQDQLRDRRRAAHLVAYDGRFDLAVEIERVLAPVVTDLATEPTPGAYLADVETVADAVHALVTSVAGTVTTRESRRKLDGLAPADRARARDALMGLSKPDAPTITRADVIAGTWPSPLVDLARPLAGPLADALGAVARTADGEPSALSIALVAGLRDLDRAVIALSRRITRARTYREMNPAPAPRPSEADEHRNTLQQLGIQA
ncbi:hypothetical protein GPOL_c32000 [Gordonia polyisoprenivorans VH2]|uniref:Uncharacterized protein n=1 Tax=Gordonia polyisoprenivorans (strain DSM 44266 / VH2) TaxID=1112204 RepID=H6MX97_GORPV|nr:hypothetical protein [Gordonia polyisoprenivorans]AFA74215.1 hypothetical protein GPOL_c32000 [Gordonia polyisoprenivorans VH2]